MYYNLQVNYNTQIADKSLISKMITFVTLMHVIIINIYKSVQNIIYRLPTILYTCHERLRLLQQSL